MFTKNQIQEIGKKLGLLGKKDTDFEDAKLPLSGEEYIVLVQNGKNVKTKVKNLGGNFQPDDPNDPENPGEPSDPDEPDTPDIPDVPDVPDVPDEPDVPDTPDDPDVPTYDPPKLYVNPKKWNVESTGGTLDVHLDPRNADESTLSAISVADDIKCERLSTTSRIFNVTMPENKTGNIRYETITFSVVGLDGTTAEATLNIEQKAATITEEDKVPTVTFLPPYLTFEYNDVNVEKEIRGTFTNCEPLNGMTDNNIAVELEEDLGLNIYKFNVKLLKGNYTSNQVTYTGKIKYITVKGFEEYFTFKVHVKAAPKGSITLSDDTLNFNSNAETKVVTAVTSNTADSTITYTNPNEWISVTERADHTYNISVLSNMSTSSRFGNIAFSATGLDGNKVGATLQVIQAGNTEAGGDTETAMMYRGYINADLINEFELGASGASKIYENVTEDVLNRGIEMGIITKEPLKEKGKTLFPDTPKSTILIFAIPHSSSMNVYKDDGIGNSVTFNQDQLHVNGETVVMIGNEAYRLYGEYQSIDIINGSKSYYIK
jgi:hypothetical protein